LNLAHNTTSLPWASRPAGRPSARPSGTTLSRAASTLCCALGIAPGGRSTLSRARLHCAVRGGGDVVVFWLDKHGGWEVTTTPRYCGGLGNWRLLTSCLTPRTTTRWVRREVRGGCHCRGEQVLGTGAERRREAARATRQKEARARRSFPVSSYSSQGRCRAGLPAWNATSVKVAKT
jgi:hypothetical protein